MSNILEKAKEIARKAHLGQKDKAGEDYIYHPLWVSAHVDGEKTKTAALLHDVLEDTSVTSKDLLNQGIPREIVNSVIVLTRKSGEDYFDYIKRVKKDPVARQVKIADLKHNIDLSRLPKVTEEDIKRNKKYRKALEYLEN
ncbi:HD domain-containing protein [Erysipelotrichaceae bacterium Oil+RF-744-GAM-WT-6]|uniref:HD domain-containing protein n=1 Tax=Stecheria intestinalis TaxID=2606630 RepID=A0A7X2NRB8_9FIRM|nr:HD domain-containing protein [Stecheria intestinalis]MSS57638.1 HD domain-containing protein [Stecheria intestinalis]